MNPGDSQSNVYSEISKHWSSTTSSSEGRFIQSGTHKRELLFPSLLLPLILFFSFSCQITVRIIILSPLREKKTNRKNKETSCREGKQLFINFIVSLLASASSLPSHSSLRPPCYEAIMWIFMKSDLYQQKNKRTAHSVSCPPSLSLLCCNPPSCSPSPIFISPSYLDLSHHITPSNALPPSPSQGYIFAGFHPAFLS